MCRLIIECFFACECFKKIQFQSFYIRIKRCNVCKVCLEGDSDTTEIRLDFHFRQPNKHWKTRSNYCFSMCSCIFDLVHTLLLILESNICIGVGFAFTFTPLQIYSD